MSENAAISEIADGVSGLYVKTDRFKTRRVTLSFVLPVDKKSAASAELISKLLVSCSEKYPSYTSLHRTLNALYGAKLGGGVSRIGDVQLLSFSVESLCDRYALSGESVEKAAVDMLLCMIFETKTENGIFSESDFQREKRLLIEKINSRMNSKRKYAVGKMIEAMCSGEAFGVEESGGLEAAESLDNREVYDYYLNTVLRAPARVSVTGADSPDDVYELISKRLSKRELIKVATEMSPSVHSGDVKNISEEMDVTQGKLVLGFKTGRSSALQNVADMQVFADIFGGGPYSLLFTVVREKMSLCYYCAARFYSLKGVLCVDSGIEMNNYEATLNGIKDQLERIKKGDFDDELIENSKMAINDSLKGVFDSPAAIEYWYMARMFDKNLLSPAEYANAVKAVTKESIIKAANDTVLDTVFFLKGKEDAADE